MTSAKERSQDEDREVQDLAYLFFHFTLFYYTVADYV